MTITYFVFFLSGIFAASCLMFLANRNRQKEYEKVHSLSCPYCHREGVSSDDLEKFAEEWKKAYVTLRRYKQAWTNDRVELLLETMTDAQRVSIFGEEAGNA